MSLLVYQREYLGFVVYDVCHVSRDSSVLGCYLIGIPYVSSGGPSKRE